MKNILFLLILFPICCLAAQKVFYDDGRFVNDMTAAKVKQDIMKDYGFSDQTQELLLNNELVEGYRVVNNTLVKYNITEESQVINNATLANKTAAANAIRTKLRLNTTDWNNLVTAIR